MTVQLYKFVEACGIEFCPPYHLLSSAELNMAKHKQEKT